MSLYTVNELLYSNKQTRVSVYRGTMNSSSASVAIKEQLFPSLSLANSAIQEAMTMASLSHPHIISILDCRLEAEMGWMKSIIVMELMDRDMSEEIERRSAAGRVWSDGELVGIMRNLVQALGFAESKGVSHRDIKPKNLFLSRAGVVKLGDFGSNARNLFFSHERGTIQGTPFYMSPELRSNYLKSLHDPSSVAGSTYDPIKADVYSLGLTIAHMALLKPPDSVGRLVDLETEIRRLVWALPQYPHVQPMLDWMLKVDPAERPTFSEIERYFSQHQEYYDQLVEGSAQAWDGSWQQPREDDRALQQVVSQCANCHIMLPPDFGLDLCAVCRASQSLSPCAMCGSPIIQKLESLPPSLQHMSPYQSFCCSVECLSKLPCDGEGKECMQCHCLCEDEKVEMHCGHAFHCAECLFEFVIDTTANYTLQFPSLGCKFCEERFIFKEIKEKVGKSYYKALKKQKCVRCGERSDLIKDEKSDKLFCPLHLSELLTKRYQKPKKPKKPKHKRR